MRDNVFVERLWRPLKHEEFYLRACKPVNEARASIGRYLGFYNRRRLHQGLPPDARSGLHRIAAANPGVRVTKGRNHLPAAWKLFKQTGPLL